MINIKLNDQYKITILKNVLYVELSVLESND